MKLDKNSINSLLYRWFYGTKVMPTNLCPYFWKLVMAWLCLIPYSILSMPIIIGELISKSYENGDNSTFSRIGSGILIYFLLFLVFLMGVAFSLFFVDYIKGSIWLRLSAGGIILWLAIIVLGIISGVKYINEKINDRKFKDRYDENGYYIQPEPKSNIIKEFVKAKYNKYCPKIEWIENNKK